VATDATTARTVGGGVVPVLIASELATAAARADAVWEAIRVGEAAAGNTDDAVRLPALPDGAALQTNYSALGPFSSADVVVRLLRPHYSRTCSETPRLLLAGFLPGIPREAPYPEGSSAK